MWLLESADRSRVGVVVASKTLRNVWVPSADQMNVPCRDALDSFHASAPEDYADGKQLIRKAATSALTFTTFS